MNIFHISKGTFEIPHKISYPHIERHNFYKVEILRALKFKSSEVFLKASLVTEIYSSELSYHCPSLCLQAIT